MACRRGPRVSRAWSGGSTRAWRRLRAQVLDRDHHRCQATDPATGLLCEAPATTAGHILARELGGRDVPDNVRAECERHNYGGGARIARARRRRRAWSW